MAKLTTQQLHAQADAAAEQYATRQRLGGYNTDSGTILFLAAAVLNLTNEVLDLRREIQKIKRAKK